MGPMPSRSPGDRTASSKLRPFNNVWAHHRRTTVAWARRSMTQWIGCTPGAISRRVHCRPEPTAHLGARIRTCWLGRSGARTRSTNSPVLVSAGNVEAPGMAKRWALAINPLRHLAYGLRTVKKPHGDGRQSLPIGEKRLHNLAGFDDYRIANCGCLAVTALRGDCACVSRTQVSGGSGWGARRASEPGGPLPRDVSGFSSTIYRFGRLAGRGRGDAPFF